MQLLSFPLLVKFEFLSSILVIVTIFQQLIPVLFCSHLVQFELWLCLLSGWAVWCWLIMVSTRLTKSGWCAFMFKWNSDGITLLLKYLLNKNIQNIFLENKCKISEKQLEQLANLYAYGLKKRVKSWLNSC